MNLKNNKKIILAVKKSKTAWKKKKSKEFISWEKIKKNNRI